MLTKFFCFAYSIYWSASPNKIFKKFPKYYVIEKSKKEKDKRNLFKFHKENESCGKYQKKKYWLKLDELKSQ
jgi:hypothetical protein